MGPRRRISRSICSRMDKASSFLAFLSAEHRAILRGTEKHFDEIVVQSVIELVLQMPGELRMIEVAGMDRKHIGVNGDGRVLQVDQNFDRSTVLARGKGEQRMLIELQMVEDSLQGIGHASIVLSGRRLSGKVGSQFPVLSSQWKMGC